MRRYRATYRSMIAILAFAMAAGAPVRQPVRSPQNRAGQSQSREEQA